MDAKWGMSSEDYRKIDEENAQRRKKLREELLRLRDENRIEFEAQLLGRTAGFTGVGNGLSPARLDQKYHNEPVFTLNDIPLEDVVAQQKKRPWRVLVKVDAVLSYDYDPIQAVNGDLKLSNEELKFRQKFQKRLQRAADTVARALEIQWNAIYDDLMGVSKDDEHGSDGKEVPGVATPDVPLGNPS